MGAASFKSVRLEEGDGASVTTSGPLRLETADGAEALLFDMGA